MVDNAKVIREIAAYRPTPILTDYSSILTVSVHFHIFFNVTTKFYACSSHFIRDMRVFIPNSRKIMLRKRYIIECINELLKNKANLVHSRHRSVHNFIMNLCSTLTAYCFFENKPQALAGTFGKIETVGTLF